ncbi:MAG TPA: hypothetical protein VGH19_16495 [Verrucomicrobiae bacterium]
MNLPTNPYVRAFLIGFGWLIAAIIVSLAHHPGTWADFPKQRVLILALISAVTAAQLGVIATHVEKMRSWTKLFIGTMIGWFAVVGLIFLVTKNFVSPAPPNEQPAKQFATTDTMMAHFSGEAVKWVKQDRSLTLNFSPDSIKIIEEELGRLHKTRQIKDGDKGLLGLAIGYGAYVGEVIRREHGGTWATDHPEAGLKSYPLTLSNPLVTIFPVNWCYKRLVNGENDNVYFKATAWKLNLTNVTAQTNAAPSSR